MSNTLHLTCTACGAVNRIPGDRLGNEPRCGKCKQAILTGEPVALGDQTFARFTEKNDLPVVVDFWASWCGPCKMMAPAFAQAATAMASSVRFAKVDTEQNQSVAAQFGIRSIPTLIVLKHGREIARQAGAMDAANIQRWVQSVI